MSVRGIDKVIARLRKLGTEAEQFVKDEVEGAGRDIEARAKAKAPKDLGTLARMINYSPTNNGFGAEVAANAPYSIYQEVGTGGLVNIPPELRELAEYYKGKGVKQINLRPQPFLYPALVEVRKEFIENLRKGLVKLAK